MSDWNHIHFVQSLEPLQGGGLGVAARQLHQSMGQAGLKSQLFTTRGVSTGEEWPGVMQCHRFGPTKLFFAPSLGQAAAASVQEGVICHGHGLYVYPNLVFGRVARKRAVPLVYHVHGFFEPWILNRSRWKKRTAHWLFENANFRHVRLWRALTLREADQIKAVVGVDAAVVVAPNGIDLEPVLPACFPRSTGRKRALFLGRLHPKKGLDLLIHGWAAAGALTKDWELIIAGPDEAGHEAEVRRLVQARGLDDRITLTGSVSGAKKYALIASADLFVLTSYSEGLPMAPLEAMAAGVPVLLTHECNLPEAASENAGWFASADPAAVAVALKAALNADDGELRQRGSAGRSLVGHKFNWKKTVATLCEACQQIG